MGYDGAPESVGFSLDSVAGILEMDIIHHSNAKCCGLPSQVSAMNDLHTQAHLSIDWEGTGPQLQGLR